MDRDAFRVRWTGQVKPRHSETYTFYTGTDGGAKLWVNGTLLIDNTPKKGLVENRGTISLKAGGRYDLVMEYAEDKGNPGWEGNHPAGGSEAGRVRMVTLLKV